ncbi:hypothetical protein [Ethanoligenens harbinense]|uniref:Uncharacterized protein n=1 Tax=Ethanoligenens harbinense (strain DSM 18485 / JCM 12961 / CGMCC 1.5033 / YUAN-3) TaxID=663278 RepID=E6U6N3_ETHHY|nr:hypothetical protein [Ethanoligenens harbinense]ADU25766.1 hypothetical protein Ethha_0179 [Ethanoligenens harbinense YUAN-3]AVQ94936.1 hypothetical protein CXQ68_00925 [Ethanoligenens harbinense YUAN-3]AYF37628.1 hypothetical protein CXP51_00930 [Ethanoligenens harbinense]AYF40348.1 hypothetical protein CN246_00925 [Ethanoligenens harbinense]QCN91184.1 hypothetical protein DRA42_00940 [Ethanoligenens harbinense]
MEQQHDKRTWNLSRAAAITALCSLGILVCLGELRQRNIFFYFFGLQTKLVLRITGGVLLSAVCGLIMVNLKNVVLTTIAAILYIIALMLYFICNVWTSGEEKYYEFQSPDHKRTIVVEECSWLLAGGSNVYQKTSPFTITKLKSDISTDDGYRPFENKDFAITWSARTVTIAYGFGNGGDTRPFTTVQLQ